jgi:hypothetical protein
MDIINLILHLLFSTLTSARSGGKEFVWRGFLVVKLMLFGDSAVGEMGQSEIWGSRKYKPIQEDYG